MNVGPLTSIPPPRVSDTSGAQRAPGAPFRLPVPGHDVVETLSTTPPPEAAAELARTAGAPERLAAVNRELHYEVDDRGRVQVQLRDLEGTVLRHLSASEALALASEPLPPGL